MTDKEIIRCGWAVERELDKEYHDKEWGRPEHGDQRLFEMLILETMQAGLSWATILAKRDNFKKAFDNFDPILMSEYDEKKKAELLADAGIIRNRLKIEAAIHNAAIFLKVQKEYGSFDKFLWQYVDFQPIDTPWETMDMVPATTEISDRLSKDMKKIGFKFVGSTTIYAYMQSIGMVNDHIKDCFCRHQ